jgi:hypothetical protein
MWSYAENKGIFELARNGRLRSNHFYNEDKGWVLLWNLIYHYSWWLLPVANYRYLSQTPAKF